ncbi:MAG: tannase/feruloyl esterase family alpha/beta hydrolase [Gammaproteobacteria bacterium]
MSFGRAESKRTTGGLIGVALVTLIIGHAAAACESLAGKKFGATAIVSADVVRPGGFKLPGNSPGAAATNSTLSLLSPFCRVQAVAKPTTDSAIGLEIWLPESGWNGKLLAVGNGAWAGSISYGALADAVAAGYAAASTDTGHVGNTVDFAIGHPEKLVDFAHRAVHEMALAAKAVVESNYSRRADRAYFSGCSTGGRQALAEAQRYPRDFDGIVAGAPAYSPTHIQGTQVWAAAVNANQAGEPLRQREFDLVNKAVIAACDTQDGVADGVIENPRACPFDPASLVCGTGSKSACLSPAQADTVRLTYRGPVDNAGKSIFPGLSRGSERSWQTLSGDKPLSLAFDTYAQLVFGDPDWNFRFFDAARDIPLGVERIGRLMDSADPNLDAFIEHGGKLLLYHGWADPGIPAEGTVRYYDAVRRALGADATEKNVRLFMVPGMGHCRGGTGTDTFDTVAALDRWVRAGATPERIEASRVENGAVVRTRPLCAYPTRAVYSGSGSTDDSKNFVCE